MPDARVPRPPSPLAQPRALNSWLARLLWLLMLLSLIAAAVLAVGRVGFEQTQKSTLLLMDFAEVSQQASALGREPLELLDHYRQEGVGGVALYEKTVQTDIQRGLIQYKDGNELALDDPQSGAKPTWTYLRSIRPGAVERLVSRFTVPSRTVTVRGQTWTGWPSDVRFLPNGPDTVAIAALKARGYVLAYRPYDSPSVRNLGADWPDVPFIIFNGLRVVGADRPAVLARVNTLLGQRLPAIIEGNPQKGIDTLTAGRPGVRTFSIRPEWQKLLQPDEVAGKFVLAARERSQRLLYARPFDTVEDTDVFLKRTAAGLDKAGIKLGQPEIGTYTPSTILKLLSALGPLAALALLALSFPLARLGWLTAGATLLLAVGTNPSEPFGALALLAAVTFPVLGFVLRRDRPTDWLLATGLSLLGVLFVSALGAGRLSMMGLDPFHGVGLTLVVPLAIFAASLLPRQDIRQTAADIYNAPLKLGDILIILAGLAVIALIVLRRGNTPAVGVSAAESKVRAALQDSIIRPRFKELAGHPAAILGLSRQFPPYMNNLLLLGGVVGQSSVLNTFAHFHTPLLISGQRAINGILIGGVIGFVLIPLVAWGLRLWRSGPGPQPRLGAGSAASEAGSD